MNSSHDRNAQVMDDWSSMGEGTKAMIKGENKLTKQHLLDSVLCLGTQVSFTLLGFNDTKKGCYWKAVYTPQIAFQCYNDSTPTTLNTSHLSPLACCILKCSLVYIHYPSSSVSSPAVLSSRFEAE